MRNGLILLLMLLFCCSNVHAKDDAISVQGRVLDNMQSYKNALAAKIFSNVLHEGQSISDTPLKEEKEQIKLSTVEKIDTKQSFENDEDVNSSKGMSRK